MEGGSMSETLPPTAPSPDDKRNQDQRKRMDILDQANKLGTTGSAGNDMKAFLDKLVQVVADIDRNGKVNAQAVVELKEQIKQIGPSVQGAVKQPLADIS